MKNLIALEAGFLSRQVSDEIGMGNPLAQLC